MYFYIFCENCGLICDIDHDYEEEIEKYICQNHGEVNGIKGEPCLCIGCENFDPFFPFSRDKPIDGGCDVYFGMSFKLFKRKANCKHFEVSGDG